MALTITPLQEQFAARVAGIDLGGEIDASTVETLWRAIDTYAVLVFHDQKLTDEQQLAFTLNFGVIEPGFGNNRVHFRTEREARALGKSIGDFSNLDPAGKPLASDSRGTCQRL